MTLDEHFEFWFGMKVERDAFGKITNASYRKLALVLDNEVDQLERRREQFARLKKQLEAEIL